MKTKEEILKKDKRQLKDYKWSEDLEVNCIDCSDCGSDCSDCANCSEGLYNVILKKTINRLK